MITFIINDMYDYYSISTISVLLLLLKYKDFFQLWL